MKLSHPYVLIVLVAVSCFVTACNKFGNKDAILAEVGDKQLTWKELMEIIPDNSTPEDSIQLAERYVENWLKEQVVLAKAEESLAEEKKDFETLIENYRKSLLIYTYEQEWIKQKLDTIVSEQEIVDYYDSNEKNFELKNYIVKVKFCAINMDNKMLPSLKKLFYSVKPEDFVKWEQLCVDLNASYYFNEDKWLLWEDLVKQIPLQTMDIEAFLNKNKNFEFDKDNNIYLLTITDYQLSGSKSPLDFEREKIRDMIINRRKMELLDRMKEDLYNKALTDKKIKTFIGS